MLLRWNTSKPTDTDVIYLCRYFHRVFHFLVRGPKPRPPSLTPHALLLMYLPDYQHKVRRFGWESPACSFSRQTARGTSRCPPMCCKIDKEQCARKHWAMINSIHNQHYTDAPPKSIQLLIRGGQNEKLTLHEAFLDSESDSIPLVAWFGLNDLGVVTDIWHTHRANWRKNTTL
jgi:hypothetical protein